MFQIDSGYEDENDANALRVDPLFKLAAGRAPLAPETALEGALEPRDIYRLARNLVEQFIAGYAQAPATITLETTVPRWVHRNRRYPDAACRRSH